MIHTLVDVVSKNGNLLLNVPVRGDGTIDSDELAVVIEIGDWMQINKESIYATRPWKIFGEGPAKDSAAPLSAQGFNEGKGKPFEAQDIRFNTKGKILYATALGWPTDGKINIKSLFKGSELYPNAVKSVKLLGAMGSAKFVQTSEGLSITVPGEKTKLGYALVFKIS